MGCVLRDRRRPGRLATFGALGDPHTILPRGLEISEQREGLSLSPNRLPRPQPPHAVEANGRDRHAESGRDSPSSRLSGAPDQQDRAADSDAEQVVGEVGPTRRAVAEILGEFGHAGDQAGQQQGGREGSPFPKGPPHDVVQQQGEEREAGQVQGILQGPGGRRVAIDGQRHHEQQRRGGDAGAGGKGGGSGRNCLAQIAC